MAIISLIEIIIKKIRVQYDQSLLSKIHQKYILMLENSIIQKKTINSKIVGLPIQLWISKEEIDFKSFYDQFIWLMKLFFL